MMKFNTLREVIQFRIVESEDNYWVEDYWKAAIEMYVKDLSATILFFQNDCKQIFTSKPRIIKKYDIIFL